MTIDVAIGPATRRLFFALWPDETVRDALVHATRKAVRASGGRPVPTVSLHATLLFIGSVLEDRVTDLESAAADVRAAPFTVIFNQLEHWQKPGILCATAKDTPEAALRLAASLARNAARAGFVPDVKPFRAHVTVARKVVKPHAQGTIHPVVWPVDGFALVESQTLPEGARYTVVRRW